jgi:L-fuculose-phosphate aldolase
MDKELISESKKNIIAVGRLLWEKDLASVLNGNISVRVDEQHILLTAHKTCLGLLHGKDILSLTLDGQLLEEGEVSTEKLLHTAIYKNFPDVKAVIHTHTIFTNAYFLENDAFEPRIFESRFWLGEVRAVDQTTPSVTDAQPVIDALRKNNLMVLRNHGAVAVGKDLFDCFLLIQSLEDAIKIDAISRLYKASGKTPVQPAAKLLKSPKVLKIKRCKLFSDEQIKEIVKLVNADKQMKELGVKTNMTMELAVKLDETGKVYSFHFEKGKIAKVSHNEKAEFLISAPEKIWRAVFNNEIDPFVATTQKKMNLRGDFAKLSKWYAPCSRIFEVWRRVPVE